MKMKSSFSRKQACLLVTVYIAVGCIESTANRVAGLAGSQVG